MLNRTILFTCTVHLRAHPVRGDVGDVLDVGGHVGAVVRRAAVLPPHLDGRKCPLAATAG